MKRSSVVAMCCSCAALVGGLGGAVAPSLRSSLIPTRSQAGPLPVNGATNTIASTADARPTIAQIGPPLELTPLTRSDKVQQRFDVIDLRNVPGGTGFEALSLNSHGDVLGFVVDGTFTGEGPGMGILASHVQMIAAPRWALLRQGRFLPIVETAPKGYLHTVAMNDRGQLAILTGPRGRRGRLEPQPGDVTLRLWENGAIRKLPIVDEIRRSTHQEVTTGLLAMNDRGQVMVSQGRSIVAWEPGKVTPLGLRYVFGFNNQGQAIGNPVNHSAVPERSDTTLRTVCYDLKTGAVTPVSSGSDIVFDINDRNEALCSFRRAAMGTERDRFYMLSGEKSTNMAVVSGAISARINNRGQAVLGRFLYEDGKVYDLETLVAPGSPWKLQYVLDLNDNGDILMRAFNVTERVPRSILLRPRKTGTPALAFNAQR